MNRPPRHRRLGELIGTGLLLGQQERIAVNQVGAEIQLVRMSPDFRALAEYVPPDDRADQRGWIRTAERVWNLIGLEWHFESLQASRARWLPGGG